MDCVSLNQKLTENPNLNKPIIKKTFLRKSGKFVFGMGTRFWWGSPVNFANTVMTCLCPYYLLMNTEMQGDETIEEF